MPGSTSWMRQRTRGPIEQEVVMWRYRRALGPEEFHKDLQGTFKSPVLAIPTRWSLPSTAAGVVPYTIRLPDVAIRDGCPCRAVAWHARAVEVPDVSGV